MRFASPSNAAFASFLLRVSPDDIHSGTLFSLRALCKRSKILDLAELRICLLNRRQFGIDRVKDRNDVVEICSKAS